MQSVINNNRNEVEYTQSYTNARINSLPGVRVKRYSLKEQMDELTGKTNFSKTLEEVNLIIGILFLALLIFFLH